METSSVLKNAPSGFRSRFRWNPRASHGHGQYVDQRGRFVSWKAVRDDLYSVLDKIGEENVRYSKQLRAGEINLAEWQRRMADNVKTSHLVSHAIQKGGWAQMSPADYGRVGGVVRREYEYLRNFAQQISNGEQALDGSMDTRARMYGLAARNTFYRAVSRTMEMAGFVEVKNIRHAEDSCADCIEATEAGWVSLEQMTSSWGMPGDRICLRHCKCTFAYRHPQSGEVERFGFRG